MTTSVGAALNHVPNAYSPAPKDHPEAKVAAEEANNIAPAVECHRSLSTKMLQLTIWR